MAGPPQKVGETQFWDSFTKNGIKDPTPSGHINVGVGITADVNAYEAKAKNMSLFAVAKESQTGGDLDIKTSFPGLMGSKDKAREGFLLNGKYVSLRDAGNILYGRNMANKGISKAGANRAAGGYAVTGDRWGALRGLLGKEYGPAPYYGEDDITGTRIDLGHDQRYQPPILPDAP
jgi:filamentous hemagglutinin